MKRDFISDVLSEDSDSSSFEKVLFSLRAEGGALVLCPRGILSLNSSKLVYAVLERTQPRKKKKKVKEKEKEKEKSVFFFTPGFLPWIVCGGDWIVRISWDVEKPPKSPVEVWSLRFLQ